ncbi:hypothetical protein MNEG_7743 [Monoraphidium neglectum]|uniref:Uncharacterized protein n=1 Tax=Monoraphidium neglectum TaxID=145388 RepID=A0A0D2MHS2_9CHLO|nr:hypothetical protein MNEG_7743 [Monoraphidium neglectum]KIZ00222.1 hypothetical protein MNEG_7743 [Monoraphidium neglectum]|eukprot:XP_013899241.1 hypothetical protein MNEG_7743 [Monoraphidium neglectum]
MQARDKDYLRRTFMGAGRRSSAESGACGASPRAGGGAAAVLSPRFTCGAAGAGGSAGGGAGGDAALLLSPVAECGPAPIRQISGWIFDPDLVVEMRIAAASPSSPRDGAACGGGGAHHHQGLHVSKGGGGGGAPAAAAHHPARISEEGPGGGCDEGDGAQGGGRASGDGGAGGASARAGGSPRGLRARRRSEEALRGPAAASHTYLRPRLSGQLETPRQSGGDAAAELAAAGGDGSFIAMAMSALGRLRLGRSRSSQPGSPRASSNGSWACAAAPETESDRAPLPPARLGRGGGCGDDEAEDACQPLETRALAAATAGEDGDSCGAACASAPIGPHEPQRRQASEAGAPCPVAAAAPLSARRGSQGSQPSFTSSAAPSPRTVAAVFAELPGLRLLRGRSGGSAGAGQQ